MWYRTQAEAIKEIRKAIWSRRGSYLPYAPRVGCYVGKRRVVILFDNYGRVAFYPSER
ncbi:MAG TPA: hypothetical protein VJ253_10775 [Dehalococcoidia bacterium]|nr:hypothetical protein [Dehalococcoidia bacterium]